MLPLLSCMTVRTLFRLILAILVPLLSGCGRDAVDPSEIHDYMTIMSSAEAADITPSQTIEDRYGYRWVRSSNRLFIYDGTNYVQCIRTDDPGSLSSETCPWKVHLPTSRHAETGGNYGIRIQVSDKLAELA